MSHPFAEYEPIFAALKQQGFDVRKTGKGHFEARSPDKAQQLVYFAVTSERRALKNTIRDLKRAGFAWNESEEKAEPMFSMPTVVPAFPMFKAGDLKAAPAKPPEPPPDIDALFKDLKDRKEMVQLCEETHAGLLRVFLEAKRNVEHAAKETDEAHEALAASKRAFDEFFAAGEKKTA